jgi:DNA-binding winged helix-turn-helix (wHTH) protein
MGIGKGDDQIFDFGDFTLSPKERLLLHAGEPVTLTAKSFDLLVALVRRCGHLVTKDELLGEVWPGTFVQEVNLTVNISALRKALRRGRADQGLIRTVSAHGYRFVAPVRVRNSSLTHQIRRVTTGNADAYRSYLQGRHEWSQRSEPALKRAIARFQDAISLDPGFAAAHSGIADCYATMGSLSYVAPIDAFPYARQYATRALELDATLPDAHASLGFVELYHDWNWSAADIQFKRAIALDPGYPPAHQWYGTYLMAAACPMEALAEMYRARQRDPLSLPINTDIGFCHYFPRRISGLDEAIKSLAGTTRRLPRLLMLRRGCRNGRFHQQLAALSKALQGVLPMHERLSGKWKCSQNESLSHLMVWRWSMQLLAKWRARLPASIGLSPSGLTG